MKPYPANLAIGLATHRAAAHGLPRGLALSAATLALLAALGSSNARAENECFTDGMTIDDSFTKVADGKELPQYMLGVDRLLLAVSVMFFPDGRVCGVSAFPPIRFQGMTVADSQMRLTFVPPPPGDPASPAQTASADDPSAKAGQRQRESMSRLFRSKVSGTASQQTMDDLVLWEGRLQGADGKDYEFYLKRTRPTVKKPPPGPKDFCGDGGCDPLTINVVVKKGSEAQLLRDARNMSISKIEPVKECETRQLKNDEVCFLATTYPLEEGQVVKAFKLKSYVRHTQRTGGASGADTETLFLQSDKLLSSNRSLNLAVVVPMFQQAIARHFEGTGLTVSEASPRRNSLFWDLKGQRFQFEKKSNPSPAEKSEWWKVRLQVAVTEANSGTYVLLIGLPETRIFSWGLSSVPNDEKFTTELTNDDRFLDLQAQLIVTITKLIPATKETP